MRANVELPNRDGLNALQLALPYADFDRDSDEYRTYHVLRSATSERLLVMDSARTCNATS